MHGPKSSRIEWIQIAGGIAPRRRANSLARVKMVLGDVDDAQELGPLDQGGDQAHGHVPVDVAVQKEDAGMADADAENGVGVGLDVDGVPAGRGCRGVGRGWVPEAGVPGGEVDDLELVPVQVVGMDARVVVVDDDLHDVADVGDEGVDLAVDGRVDVGGAGRAGRVQRRYPLLNVRPAVEGHDGISVRGVEGWGEVEHPLLGDGAPGRLVVEGAEIRLVEGL